MAQMFVFLVFYKTLLSQPPPVIDEEAAEAAADAEAAKQAAVAEKVKETMGSLTTAMLKSKVPGEEQVSLVSTNMALSMSKEELSKLDKLTLPGKAGREPAKFGFSNTMFEGQDVPSALNMQAIQVWVYNF